MIKDRLVSKLVDDVDVNVDEEVTAADGQVLGDDRSFKPLGESSSKPNLNIIGKLKTELDHAYKILAQRD